MSNNIKKKSLLIIGISGVTCGGKTTTATRLKEILPNVTIFTQDDYFLDVEDPRHIWIPELNHINFDVITSLDMEKMHRDILHFINENNFKRVNLMEKNEFDTNGVQCTANIITFVCDKMRESELNILIIEGFSIFNYKPLLNLFNLKFYFTLVEEECLRRRLERVYEPPDCPGYFEKCAWPEHLKQFHEIQKSIKDIKYIDGNSKNSVETILKSILQYIHYSC